MSENWLDDLMKETEDVETPRSWIWWSLVSTISAVAANNYYVLSYSGKVKFRPNMYVMLLGKSGLGKAFPTTLAKLLVTKSEATRVIAGRSSIQAIVQEMGTSRTNENGKPPFTDARVFIINGELSSAVIADPDALAILTDLFDGTDLPEWTNLLKGDGAKKLKDPYITALFGTSPAHFYDSIPQANIEGGYIGRNLIVYEEKRYKEIHAFSDDDTIGEQLQDRVVPEYVKHLIEITKHKGRLLLTAEAKTLYNSWKTEWRSKNIPDKTGFVERVPTHVIKVAMCLALARYEIGERIFESDIQLAIDKVTALLYANRRTTESRGLDPMAAQTRLVIDFLIQAKDNELKRKQLLSKGQGDYNSYDLDKVLENLLELGWVERERFVAGSATDWIIKLSGEPLINYRKFVERNSKQ